MTFYHVFYSSRGGAKMFNLMHEFWTILKKTGAVSFHSMLFWVAMVNCIQ